MPQVDISTIDRGIAYTRRADDALADSWPVLARGIDAMLERLCRHTGGSWVVFASGVDGLDRFNQPAKLLGVWFCGPTGELTDADWYSAAEPFRSGWNYDGLQPLGQGTPVPIRATVGAVPHEVFVPRRGKGARRVLSVGLGKDGGAIFLAAVADAAMDAVDIVKTRPAAPSPTSAHLIAMVLHAAAVALVQSGLSAGLVMQRLVEITDLQTLEALGDLPGNPSPLAKALLPYLRDPSAYLDATERQVVVKACLELLSAGGEPTEEALQVARRVAASVGVQLPI